uniref:hypothetical protein n=1 Tax=Pseudonocardia sp. CA-138482 TaxID=3240023 RepID=UPI003F4955B4
MSRPYDPEDISPRQIELATRLRVPFITTPYPSWNYVIAIVVSSPPHLWHGLVPTEDEVRVVAAYNDQYREYWYDAWWKQRMSDFAPYDIHGGTIGRYLIKRPDGGWAYRRRSWRYEPEFMPEWDAEPLPLGPVLDLDRNSLWLKWKAKHPEIVAAVS